MDRTSCVCPANVDHSADSNPFGVAEPGGVKPEASDNTVKSLLHHVPTSSFVTGTRGWLWRSRETVAMTCFVHGGAGNDQGDEGYGDRVSTVIPIWLKTHFPNVGNRVRRSDATL